LSGETDPTRRGFAARIIGAEAKFDELVVRKVEMMRGQHL
jgi:hypothetical protein